MKKRTGDSDGQGLHGRESGGESLIVVSQVEGSQVVGS